MNSIVEPDRSKEEAEIIEQNYFESGSSPIKDHLDRASQKNSQTNQGRNKASHCKNGCIPSFEEKANTPTEEIMERDGCGSQRLGRINSDTNIAVAALFEIASTSGTSQAMENRKSINNFLVPKDEATELVSSRGRKLRRQWNSKMTPEEVRLAYLHRMKEEYGSTKEGTNARRKRKREIPNMQDGKYLEDGYLEKQSYEVQDDKWLAPGNNSVNKDTVGSKSDTDDSDILEGTDSSGNGNGSSNDNNTGTGSGSGSNRGHSIKNSVQRSPALSTSEKNAEVDIWRRMNFKADDRVDMLDSSNISSNSDMRNPVMEWHHLLASSTGSSGTCLSHLKKLHLGERCSAEERKAKLERYRRKREERIFRKQVRYDVRKRLAESRPRVRGRFCKPSEQQLPSEQEEPFETQNDR